MFKKSSIGYSFMSNKVNYTVSKIGDKVAVYETDNPDAGFVFHGGLRQFIMFINCCTDIAQEMSEEIDNEDKQSV